MWTEEEISRTLNYFRRYLKDRGYGLSDQAALYLREYMMKAERRERIAEALRKREKTFEDVREGLGRLATASLQIARSKDRRTVYSSDVRESIEALLCKVFPFC